MALRNAAIQLTLKARDLLSRVVKKSSESLEQLEKQGQSLKNRLKSLEQQSKLLASFKKQATTVQSVSRAYREAREKVERLAREQSQAVAPSKQLERQLSAARKSVSGLSTQYQRQKLKLTQLREELQKSGLSNRQLNQQQDRLQAELKQTAEALKRVQRQTRQSRATLKKSGFREMARDAGQAESRIGRLGSSLRNLVLAGTGIYALKRAMQSVLSVGDKYERLAIQMEALMGSVAAGQQATVWIKEFTKSTPLQLDQVTQAFVTLKNFGLDPMDGTLLALVDQNAKLGGEFERLKRISLALGQAFGKQKLQGEELRQLIEAGVPAWQLLEKATGENVQVLRELSEKGKLGAEVIRALIAEMGASSVGAAQKNMQTLAGLWSNMKDRFDLFQRAISESGWADYIKAQLTTLGSKLDEMASNGKLQQLAANISATFIAIAESIKAFFANLTIDQFVQSVASGFQRIIDASAVFINAFSVLGNTVKALFNSLSFVVKGWATLFTGALTVAGKAVAEFAKVLGFEELQNKAKQFTGTTSTLMKDFAKGAIEDAGDIRDAYTSIGDTIASQTPQIAETLQRARASIKTTAEEIVEANQTSADSQNKLAQSTTAAVEETKAKQDELKESVKQTGEAFKSTGDNSEQVNQQLSSGGSIAQAMANHWQSLKNEIAALSPAALAAYESINQVGEADIRTLSDDMDSLRHTLDQTSTEISSMGDQFIGLDTTGLGEWMYNTKKASLEVKHAFLEEKIAFEELMDAYENGGLSAEAFAAKARTAASELDLLDQQDMDRLNRALEQAERSMDNLRKSTRSTLENLQDELDRLNGNTEAIERRRFEARKRELEQQLKNAQQSGDDNSITNLQRALAINQQVFSITTEQREDKDREGRRKQKESQTPKPTPIREAAYPSKVIRLEYPGGAVNVNVRQNDETKLLRALQTASGRSL